MPRVPYAISSVHEGFFLLKAWPFNKMAVLMDLCGVCVALNLCAAALSLMWQVPDADPAAHFAAFVALVIAGSAHSRMWALSTGGFMLTLCALGAWATTAKVAPPDIALIARAAVGASGAWYVVALLQPSRTFVAAHLVAGVAAACVMHTPSGVVFAERFVSACRMADLQPPTRKYWWS